MLIGFIALNNGWLAGLTSVEALGLMAIGVATFVLSFVGLVGEIPECRRIKALDHLVCGKCGYDLCSVEGAKCPECGILIEAETLRAFWKRYIRLSGLTRDFYDRDNPPRWQKRRQRRPVMIAMGLWILLFVGASFAWRSSPLSFGVVACLFGFTVQIPSFIAARWSSREQCKRLLASRGLVCTECGGDVGVTGEVAQCQKCRTQFVTAELLQTWERWRPAIWDIEMEASEPNAKANRQQS